MYWREGGSVFGALWEECHYSEEKTMSEEKNDAKISGTEEDF